MYSKEIEEAKNVALEIIKEAKLEKDDLIVIGCSTSEISNHTIGSHSGCELGEEVFKAMYDVFQENGISVAAQCCEHLNRALIIEKSVAKEKGYEIVNVVPMPKAGGAFSTAAWKIMDNPVAVEKIQADAGIDIGDTLIGMHLKVVAVPVRIKHSMIGSARVVCARTRPKCIGGERAHYNEELM